jgi:phosphoglycerate dehydrogenase-like enzyme
MSAHPPRVLLWNAYAANQVERLRGLLTEPVELAVSLEAEPKSVRLQALREADALISSRFGVEGLGIEGLDVEGIGVDLLQGLKLRLIQTPTSGFDRIELEALPQGCLVSNVHEHEAAIAEYVLATMLNRVIGLVDLERRFRQSDWRGGVSKPGHMHGELGGRTLGIIGFGRIGQEVVRRAHPRGDPHGADSTSRHRPPLHDGRDRRPLAAMRLRPDRLPAHC